MAETKSLDSINEYPVTIPTLRKEQKRTIVVAEEGKGLEVEEHMQAMYGGVDISVPVDKLKHNEHPHDVRNPDVDTHPFPVLVKQ